MAFVHLERVSCQYRKGYTCASYLIFLCPEENHLIWYALWWFVFPPSTIPKMPPCFLSKATGFSPQPLSCSSLVFTVRVDDTPPVIHRFSGVTNVVYSPPDFYESVILSLSTISLYFNVYNNKTNIFFQK